MKLPNQKQRLDHYLVEAGLADSYIKAQALILAGLVYDGDQRLKSAAHPVRDGMKILVRGRDHPYVSRGGVKLAAYLAAHPLELKDKCALDIGTSTGGFTDCLLQHGVLQIACVDVGYGQLAETLRCNPRVVVQDRTNFRYYTLEQFPLPYLDVFSMDVSFISVTKLLPRCQTLAARFNRGAVYGVLLVKPQFELGREHVGRGGIVQEVTAAEQALATVRSVCEQNGWAIIGDLPSPIRGRQGNREYLLGIRYDPKSEED